jgi:hypothetical protein
LQGRRYLVLTIVVYNQFGIGRRLQGDGNKNWEILGGTQQFLKIIEMGIDSGGRAGKLYLSICELFLGFVYHPPSLTRYLAMAEPVCKGREGPSDQDPINLV